MIDLASQRLILIPLSPEALAALIAQDRAAAERAVGGAFPPGALVPPLMADALDFFLKLAESSPDWGGRVYLTRETREVAGLGGFTGPPGPDGVVTMGYSVFPAHQRRGYASEAARALADWALAQPGVTVVQATIVDGNIASERVAAYAGLIRTDDIEDDPDEGPVVVWRRARDEA
ncbi:MAG: GNAT family N-acetyltransferase [Thermomicrobiales bacterium]